MDLKKDGTTTAIGEFLFNIADLFDIFVERPEDGTKVTEKHYKLIGSSLKTGEDLGGYVKITATYIRFHSFFGFFLSFPFKNPEYLLILI